MKCIVKVEKFFESAKYYAHLNIDGGLLKDFNAQERIGKKQYKMYLDKNHSDKKTEFLGGSYLNK